MKFFCSLLIGVMIVASAEPENKQADPLSRPNDQIMLVEQFLRWYFPQLDGRYANIVFTAEVPLWSFTPQTKPEPTQIYFRVDDWCDVPPNPQVGSFGPRSFPCSETDKKYEPPLKGQILFANRSGRIVVVSILLNGTLVDTAVNRPSPTCSKPELKHRAEIMRALQLPRLGALFGGRLEVITMEQNDNKSWEIVVRIASARRRYSVILDKCGFLNGVDPL